MKVYLIMGETGEFDDAREWVACVCATKRTADARARKLNEATGSDNGRNTYRAGREARKAWCQRLMALGDEFPALDYTGTTYSVEGPYTVATSA